MDLYKTKNIRTP